jgi:general secretion pathway protein D
MLSAQKIRKFAIVSLTTVSFSISGLALSGCDLSRNHAKIDREGHMEFQDYRDGLAPRDAYNTASSSMDKAPAGIPEFQSYVMQPSENLKPMPLVSISVNQTVPLRDAIFELASQAKYDVEIDPRIKGSIIFTARERPFDLVVKRVSEIAGLRYRFEDDVLRVELDTPYHKTYKIDYLSYIRTNEGQISNDVGVMSGTSTNTGSRYKTVTSSEADFWGELETSLTQVLGLKNIASELRTEEDPTIRAVDTNPAPVEAIVTTNEAGEEVVQVQAPDVQLNVQTLPDDTYARRQRGRNEEDPTRPESSFSMNKQAGIISIYGTERQHNQIVDYLKELKRSVTSQVLIEAKILEVELTDEFSTGIDWSTLAGLTSEWSLGFTGGATARPAFTSPISPANEFSISYAGNDISAVVEAVSRFGTVKALASPRMTVLNNQSAVLNVATNRVYFELDVETTTNDSATVTTVDSEIKNVPEGVLINVQPSIDLDNRMIAMAVRPTVTRIVSFENDPAVEIQDADVTSPIPVVNVQEMDSVVRLGSGQAIIMGGLMQDRVESEQQGVPILSEIPLMGGLFRNQSDSVSKTELVVFIKATIIDDTNIHDTDRELYQMFASDRRPLKL